MAGAFRKGADLYVGVEHDGYHVEPVLCPQQLKNALMADARRR